MDDSEGTSRYYSSSDGLHLHYLDYPARVGSKAFPVVCLPGLTRSVRDFEPLATFLSQRSAAPRRVIAFDYRGRGDSDFDADWRHYTLDIERDDFLGQLDALGIRRAHFIGTSRGGLHILALAAACPDIMQGVVLNDIGPVIEGAGLARIKSYVGKAAAPKSYAEAIALLKSGSGAHFHGLSHAEWQHFAETTFGQDESRLGLRYDPALARTLDAFDPDKPIPPSWELLDKLAGTPVLILRGANSDLLSTETLAQMAARSPSCETMTVPGQGHAPLLVDKPSMSRIDRFLRTADRAEAAG